MVHAPDQKTYVKQLLKWLDPLFCLILRNGNLLYTTRFTFDSPTYTEHTETIIIRNE